MKYLFPSFSSQIEYKATLLRDDVIEANFYSGTLANSYGMDVLDLHFHFRPSLQHRTNDGVHWNALAHRWITRLLLKHIAQAWGVGLPLEDNKVVSGKCIPVLCFRNRVRVKASCVHVVVLDPSQSCLCRRWFISALVFPVQIRDNLKEVAKTGRGRNICTRRTDMELLCLSHCSTGSMEVVSLTPLWTEFLFCRFFQFAEEFQMSCRFQLLAIFPH